MFFDKQCETALAIGMTWDDYWYGDPIMFSFYMEEYIRCHKEQERIMDTQAWIAGHYVAVAIAASLSDKKHPVKYPKQPIWIENDEDYQRKQQERKVAALFGALEATAANAPRHN